MKKLFNYLMNAGLDPEDLKKVNLSVAKGNHANLRVFSFMSVVFLAFTLIVTFVSRFDSMREKYIGYGLCLLGCLLIWIVDNLTVKTFDRITGYLTLLFEILFLAFGLLLSLVYSPDRMTVTLIVMFVVLPLLFVERPYKFILPIVFAVAIFISVALVVKPADVIHMDIVNCIIFSIVGVTVGVYSTKTRFERYIFECRVEEMTDQQQAVSYLKSFADVYISVHYADLQTDTFMQLRSNFYIDKNLDNLHEGFKRQLMLAIKATTKEAYQEEMVAFANVATLAERIRGKRTITHEFVGNNFGWCRARYIAVGPVTEDSVPRYIIFAVENINEQKNREETLEIIAKTETMTGLLNRESGITSIKTAMSDGHHGMLCLFDVDKFKNINDTFGHQAGDDVIKAVADAMRSAFRERDILLRLGGDEFMAYVSKIDSKEKGVQIIERLFTELKKKKFAWDLDYDISISLGATLFGEDKNIVFEELYKRVDCCTYESKKVKGMSYTFWER